MRLFFGECSWGPVPVPSIPEAPITVTSRFEAVDLLLTHSSSLSLQALNARSRALLMQKLDRTGMAAVVPPPAPLGGVPLAQIPHAQKPIGLPSQYLLLENMFDPLKEVSRLS